MLYQYRYLYIFFQLFSEKLLVIGRRITGNYRQIIYLARYQLKRFRSLLYSLLRFESRFRSSLWRITRRVITALVLLIIDLLFLFLNRLK